MAAKIVMNPLFLFVILLLAVLNMVKPTLAQRLLRG